MNVPHALPQSEWGPAAPLTALHQGWWLLQQVRILHLSRHEEDRSYLICRSTSLIYCASACVCGVYVWEGELRKPHQRTAVFDGGCVWAPSAPGSSSSVLPGWCWSPSVRSPAFQRWPASQETLIVPHLFIADYFYICFYNVLAFRYSILIAHIHMQLSATETDNILSW